MTYKSDGKTRVVISPLQQPKLPKPLRLDATTKEKIIHAIRHIVDPEIPLNIYDLGLIYNVELKGGFATITMTLTAPNCPVADAIVADVQHHVAAVEGVERVAVNLVFDPPWDKSKMTDAAKLELGLL